MKQFSLEFSCQANEPNDQMPTEYSERANVCNRLPIWIKYFEYMIHFDSVCSAHNTQFQMNSIHKILCTCLIVCLEFKQIIFFFFFYNATFQVRTLSYIL